MQTFRIIKTKVNPQSSKNILEKIKKDLGADVGFTHIVSINPENLILASTNSRFNQVLETADVQIIDGVGVVWALRFLYDRDYDRLTGSDLAIELLKITGEKRLRTLLIGGEAKIAEKIAKCYSDKYSKDLYLGISGIFNIKKPTQEEEIKIFDIVADYKPHLVLVAFGSPDQELWIERNREYFGGAICIGVGGAFDYISGNVSRAPRWLRQFGLEWLVRLILQPWRAGRQIRLITYLAEIIKQKLTGDTQLDYKSLS